MILLFSFFYFHSAQVVHPNDITIEDVLDMSKKRPTFIFFKPRKNYKNQNIIKLWEKLCSKYMTDKKKVIADFSCIKYPEQCSLMNVHFIPSIYAFYGPEYYMKYNGKYSFSAVDEWITQMSAYPVKNISSISEIYNNSENLVSILPSESVVYLATKEEDYKKLYEVAYFRNTTNIFLFLHQNNSLNDNNNRMTAFLNSNFSISLGEDGNNNFTEFVWKNQFHVPFQLSTDNIKAAKNSREYLAIYITKFKKKKQLNYDEIKLNEFDSFLYSQLKYLGENFYTTTNFCWSEIHKFSLFFKSYGITKAPALLVLKDNYFWKTKNTDLDHLKSFMNQIIDGQIKGEKMTDARVIKYDFILMLLRYPMLIFIIVMLLISIFVIIYFVHVHMSRLRSFAKFEKRLKKHHY